MIVVAGTGPLNYLVLIRHVEVLGRIHETVFIPPAVVREMQHAATPEAVVAWIQNLPAWARSTLRDDVSPHFCQVPRPRRA